PPLRAAAHDALQRAGHRPRLVRPLQHPRRGGRASIRTSQSHRSVPLESMSDLRELYQQVILDHYKNPRNYREMPAASRKVEGYNPLCGDHYTVFLDLDGDTIRDVSFTGN